MSKIKVKGGAATPVAQVGISPVGAHVSEALGAAAFSPVEPTGTVRYLLVQATAQNVRYTLDGTVPTAILGFQLVASDPVVSIPLGPGVLPQFFAEAGGANLEYQYAV